MNCRFIKSELEMQNEGVNEVEGRGGSRAGTLFELYNSAWWHISLSLLIR